MQKINELFKSKNIIYHYTKSQTAFEYILYDNKLRFSKRKTSKDPIENIIDTNISNSFYGYDNTERADEESIENVRRFLKNKLKHINQLCFCQNNFDKEFEKISTAPYEYYGFFKPRMWDQYGDSYNGVCLAFDLEQLKINNPSFYSQSVNYSEYYPFKNTIDIVKLQKQGIDEYCNDYFEKIKKNCFKKHIDYSGENEYRFISFAETDEFLDIKHSLKAIIISKNQISEFARKWFNEFASKNEIELYYISWSSSGINLMSRIDDENWEEWAKIAFEGEN